MRMRRPDGSGVTAEQLLPRRVAEDDELLAGPRVVRA